MVRLHKHHFIVIPGIVELELCGQVASQLSALPASFKKKDGLRSQVFFWLLANLIGSQSCLLSLSLAATAQVSTSHSQALGERWTAELQWPSSASPLSVWQRPHCPRLGCNCPRLIDLPAYLLPMYIPKVLRQERSKTSTVPLPHNSYARDEWYQYKHFFLSERSTTGRHSGSLPQASNLVRGITTAAGVEPQKHSEHLLTTRFPPFSSHHIASARPAAATNVFAFLPHHSVARYLCWHCVFALPAPRWPAPRWPAPASNIETWANPARDSRRATHLTILSLLSHSSTWPTML